MARDTEPVSEFLNSLDFHGCNLQLNSASLLSARSFIELSCDWGIARARLTSKTLISGWSVLTELSKTSNASLSVRVSHSEGDI